jgi:hypothetical protein
MAVGKKKNVFWKIGKLESWKTYFKLLTNINNRPLLRPEKQIVKKEDGFNYEMLLDKYTDLVEQYAILRNELKNKDAEIKRSKRKQK